MGTADRLLSIVDGLMERVLNRWRAVRICTLAWLLLLTTEAIQWTMRFLETTTRPGMEAAAMAGVITAAVSMLFGYVFTKYAQSRTPQAK